VVELAYKLNPIATWGWNFAPVLYVNGTPTKRGTDCMYTWGAVGSAGSQKSVQNSFIVSLDSGDYVEAGYDVALGAGWPGDASKNVLGGPDGGTGIESYFSISLLNRSYA